MSEDLKEQSEDDRRRAEAADNLASMWARMREVLVARGFTPQQAYSLVLRFIGKP